MPGGREAGDPASETAAALPEVKGQAGEPPIGPLGQGSPAAKGAYLTTELDAAIDPEVFLALSAGFAGLTTLEGGIRPQEDPVSLVVEIGALIDELKVREDKLGPSTTPDGSTGAQGPPPAPPEVLPGMPSGDDLWRAGQGRWHTSTLSPSVRPDSLPCCRS